MHLSKPSLKKAVLLRIAIGSAIITFGIISMLVLASMKKPPAEAPVKESSLKVKTLVVQPEDVSVEIKGFGEVIALNTVSIAPEVSGKLVRVHPRLELGEIINKGDILFEINSQDYLTAYEEALTSMLQTRNTIERLKKELEISQSRLKTLVRNKDLAKAEFERIKRLLTDNKIGTQSDVDTTERTYNSTVDQVDQMKQAIATIPLQIQEAEYALRSANARVARAEANLRRCSVKAPFSGRIKSASIEAGQYVAPGQSVVTMVDDSALEIHIPLDSVDAQKWLQFDKDSSKSQTAWFSALQALPVEIRWTEDKDRNAWEGILDRVVAFDKQTRTITVAIRIETPISLTNGSLPLVEGMFCEVSIPGKIMKDVFRLPRWAVNFRNSVYLERENRLETVPVKLARIENDEVFVSEGLVPGDHVIITRLVDPLENSLLEVIEP